ncbi:hypothetical protein OIU77_012793 [Salix suchowensis]|uniref:Uncharacterized protein n=1 Tax=Salix suchowensis TaxID=1278906 RepID=A0ABQ9A620_9ROSI|nr:hypothetical protein OIU77_012793 [Salix suchowensis]
MGCSLCIPRQSWKVENLRPQSLKNWCLGQELYIRVFDGDPNPAKDRPPPHSLLQFYAVFSADESEAPASNHQALLRLQDGELMTADRLDQVMIHQQKLYISFETVLL